MLVTSPKWPVEAYTEGARGGIDREWPLGGERHELRNFVSVGFCPRRVHAGRQHLSPLFCKLNVRQMPPRFRQPHRRSEPSVSMWNAEARRRFLHSRVTALRFPLFSCQRERQLAATEPTAALSSPTGSFWPGGHRGHSTLLSNRIGSLHPSPRLFQSEGSEKVSGTNRTQHPSGHLAVGY